ncbi:MAG TPA: GxxExxY protein [Rhodocyclaceae bacterium]|nr:GxxExxY protein [Rhodocyclaceae bacterium]
MDINDISGKVVDAAMRVHSLLGPGLLESVYEACLVHELSRTGLAVERQLALPVHYDSVVVDAGLRLDIVVEKSVVLELKSVDSLQPIHIAQLLTYLRLGHYPLGLLLNFNVVHMKDGIKRIANNLGGSSASSASSAVK